MGDLSGQINGANSAYFQDSYRQYLESQEVLLRRRPHEPHRSYGLRLLGIARTSGEDITRIALEKLQSFHYSREDRISVLTEEKRLPSKSCRSCKDRKNATTELASEVQVSLAKVETCVPAPASFLPEELQLIGKQAHFWNKHAEESGDWTVDTIVSWKWTDAQEGAISAESNGVKSFASWLAERRQNFERGVGGDPCGEYVDECLQTYRVNAMKTAPFTLTLAIHDKGDVKATADLFYLPKISTIFMKWEPCDLGTKLGSRNHAEKVLWTLVPGDSGTRCPTNIGAQTLCNLNVNLSEYVGLIGRPYVYAQSLMEAQCFKRIVRALRDRIEGLLHLMDEIRTLESCSFFEPADAGTGVALYPAKRITEMKSFKLTTAEQYLTSVPEETREKNVAEEPTSSFYAHSQFEHKSSGATMDCNVYIPVDYPRHPPVLALSVKLGGKLMTAETTPWIKTLERYVNVECLAACKPSHLLLHQMTVLCSRFDLCLQTNTE